ncbi:toxin-antitoxin system protein [filamentous cyanobacterium Phorm 6]|nr:toxin-antitoxin system protein [filamentous cyanobacterium Phorm 6]
MNQTSTVTIGDTFYQILAELSASSGKSIQAVLEQAIEQYRRQQFLEAANQAYIALRNNSEAWQEELEERSVWDITLEDGLE